MVNKVVEDLIKAADKHLENVMGIELALARRKVPENSEIFREIEEIRKYKQWIKNINKEFNEIDNNFKQIMRKCANIYHELLEELKKRRYERTNLYKRVAEIHNIFESLHSSGLSSDTLLMKRFSAIFTELNRIKIEIGNNQDLRSLFVKYSGKIDVEVKGRLNGNVIDKIAEINNIIKNLIDRIKKTYSRIKTYENIYKEIAKGEEELHKEIEELEKLYEEIKYLIVILSNFEKQIVQIR